MRWIAPWVLVLSALGACLYKMRDLRRDPENHALRSLCAMYLLLGLGVLFRMPVVADPLEAATGLFVFWADITIVGGLVALQVTLVLWRYPLERARPMIRRRLMISVAGALVITVLYLLGRMDPAVVQGEDPFVDRMVFLFRQRWWAEAHLNVQIVLTYTMGDMVLMNLRHRRLLDRRWLRRGLDTVTLGGVIAIGNTLIKCVQIVAARYFDKNVFEMALVLEPLTLGFAGVLMFWGWTLPAWGPRLDRAMTLHRLRPLWLALSRATPEVVFEMPGGPFGRWWRVTDLDLRLYRRIIEIRDSRLALRPYLDQEVVDATLRRGRAAGLEGERLRAAVEAALLAAAVRAKADARVPHRPFADTTPGAMDLAEEVIWLAQVARAFTAPANVAAPTAQSTDPAGVASP